MTDLQVSVDGQEFQDAKRRLKVHPGASLDYRAILTPYDGSEDVAADLHLEVPDRFRRTVYVEIRGGIDNYYGYDYYCFSEFGSCGETGNKVGSVEDLIQALQEKPKNNELIATVRVGRKIVSEDSAEFDQVVSGRHFTYLIPKGKGSADEACAGSGKQSFKEC
jgi:hypothetical protein